MLYEFFQALIKAGLPVALMSFLLMFWSMYRGHLTETGSMKELKAELKQLSKNKDKDKDKNKEDCEKTGDPLHNKWMKFGGGFYGVVAMMTLLVIEWADIKDFGFAGLLGLTDNLSLEMLLETTINMVIESFNNFIAAISWPVYWMGEIDSEHIWLWFVAAYAGYSGGSQLARYQVQVRKEEIND